MTVVQMKDVLPPMPEVPQAGGASQLKGNGFSQTFDSATRNVNEAKSEKQQGTDKASRNQVDSNVAKDAGNAMKKARRTESSKDEAKTDAVCEDNLKQMEETAEVMVQQVAEVTNTTPEEVTEALEALGLSEDALFTKEGLGMVLTELKNVEDPILIVTDPEFSAQLTALNETADNLLAELQSDLGLSDEGMAELVEAFGEESLKVTPNEEPVNEPMIVEEKPADTVARPVQEAEQGKTEEPDTEFGVNTEAKAEVTEAPVRKDADREEGKSGNDTGKHHETNVSQPVFMKETGEVVFRTETTVEAEVPRMSAQEIFRQIGDYIKTVSSENMESVEMQLHPESLGSLQIRVTSKGGNVTASFVAQNEAVRAALETQVVALKQSFEEQGIKVDAVEVTVSTHQFESAMEQGNQSTGGGEQREAKRPSTRSLNLNEEIDVEELTEEEQIAVEMMEANGNTVDYKA